MKLYIVPIINRSRSVELSSAQLFLQSMIHSSFIVELNCMEFQMFTGNMRRLEVSKVTLVKTYSMLKKHKILCAKSTKKFCLLKLQKNLACTKLYCVSQIRTNANSKLPLRIVFMRISA